MDRIIFGKHAKHNKMLRRKVNLQTISTSVNSSFLLRIKYTKTSKRNIRRKKTFLVWPSK